MTKVVAKEKISSPTAGLVARNLRDSGAGAHPVPCWERSAGFSHPQNPKISRLASAQIAAGEINFLFIHLLRPSAERPRKAEGFCR